MIAKSEDGYVKLYNEQNEIVGKIKTNIDGNTNQSELATKEETFKIVRDGWTFRIYKGDEVVHNLKTNSFFGDITLLELNKKIKGVFSLKWGTQLVDDDNNTLLKIRNENQLVNNGNYIIEVSDETVSDFEILLSLFGHMHGSKMKTISVIAG